MQGVAEEYVPAPAAPEPAPARVETAPTKRLGIGGWLAAGWMVFIISAALLAPLLPLKDHRATTGAPRSGPSADHLLGTDAIGRDLVARVVWGGRASLLVGAAAIAFGMIIGGAFGLVAGYYRGRLETVITTVFDTMLAIPQLVLALALVAVLATGSIQDPATPGRRLAVLILALGIVSVPVLGRITRANTLTWSEREFVTAARAMGAPSSRIMVREVLPNVLPAMFSIGLLGVAVVIVAEGGLSILGVGVQLPTPSWGNIIAEGRASLSLGAPYAVTAASTVIFLTVLALNYLGDVVRSKFDVKESIL